MTKDLHPTPPDTRQSAAFHPSYSSQQRGLSSRIPRSILVGLAIALALTCIEGIVWILNPFHLLGSTSQSLPAFLARIAHNPLWWLVLVIQVIASMLVVWAADRPLALYRFSRDTWRATEHYRTVYTPLPNWPSLYEVMVTYFQQAPDPTVPPHLQEIPLLEMVRNAGLFLVDSQAHLVLLGAPGAGRTTALYLYQFMALQQRRAMIFGREKIPIFVPLRNYNLFLKTCASSQDTSLQRDAPSLLAYLVTSDLPGMHHLRPYLPKLAEQGRLLLLCDGIHEVDEAYQPTVIDELIDLMSQQRNRVLVTCREVDFVRQPQLALAVEENLVARALIRPLGQEQMRGMVEHYIEDESAERKRRNPGYTAGQIMDMITRTRLSAICTNPLLLLALLNVVDGLGMERIKRLDTRGRLLQAYVGHLIQQTRKQPAWGEHAPTEKDILLLLGEIACAARWSNTPYAIQLHEGAHLLRIGLPTMEDHAAAVQTWLGEHADEMFLSDSLHEPYSREEVAHILRFAQNAALIEISPHGILSFRHELISAYMVAEYFMALQASYDTPLQKTRFAGLLAQVMKRQDITDAFSRWSLPLALWVGLLDEPAVYAERFVEYGRAHPGSALDVLVLSLLCLGVASVPPHVADLPQVVLPPELESMLVEVLRSDEQRVALARLFTRYAEEDAHEIYQSLFALLMVQEIDELVILLDMEVMPDLLFNRLRAIVDDGAYEAQVKRLVRLTGQLGAVAVQRAAAWSRSGDGRSLRLRSAAINILGGTGEQSAVDPLNACLYDPDPFIVGRAVNALFRLGPELSLPCLIAELDNLSPTSATAQIHSIALSIVERFLGEPNPARQLTPEQHQQVMNTLLHILNLVYAPAVQQKARELLVRQGRMAEESTGGEMAVDAFIQNLASSDDRIVHSTIQALCDIGSAAVPGLLKSLRQQPAEIARARIVETLGKVHDPRALSALLRLLADPSLLVQQQVAQALFIYGPESIPGLIYQVLQSEEDRVAARAEEILGDIGEAAVEPVIDALIPLVPGRTHLLVRALARIHDAQAIPTLIALLETTVENAQVDQSLLLALIDALGQFQDERVVAPLMEMLASSNALFYEGAINALSSLEVIACDQLIDALDVEQDTAITTRVERALLGMVHFPGERLLAAFARGSEAQARHITNVLLAKGPEAAHLLVSNLFHPNRNVQLLVRRALEKMPGQVIVPALLEVIDHADRNWRAVIAEYLLKHPYEAIPPLVGLLNDNERGGAAQMHLLEFGSMILPALVTGLDSLNDLARERSCQLVAALARQTPEALVSTVQLFTLDPPPPQRAREALGSLLANELADISSPVLLEGLEDAHLVGDVSEILVHMVKKGDARGEQVLNELLESLRIDARRHGAEITLVEIGTQAVPGVGNLITDADSAVAQTAQNILCEMGVPAFSFIWAAHSDVSNRARREAARTIFRRMPTVVIKDELVQLLSSDKPDDISMALALLLERIHDEALQAEAEHEMIPVLLEHVQMHSTERASQRIIALLLLLGGRTVIDHMTQVLYDFPSHQARFLHAFLLLGEEAEETLLEVLHDSGAAPLLRAEAAGTLGILAPHMDIREYAKMLVEYGLWAGQSQGYANTLQQDQLNVSLRALGGLLAGGHWHAAELQHLRMHSKDDSPERELYEILLGWRYTPYIKMLEQELDREKEEHKQHMMILTEELLNLRAAREDLEQELEGLHREHGKRGQELESAVQTIDELRESLDRVSHEKERAHDILSGVRQEKQTVYDQLQQVTREKEQVEAELAQLEQNLRNLRGPTKK